MVVVFGILRFGSLTWIGKTKNNKNKQNKHIYQLYFNYKIKTCVLHFKIAQNQRELFVCLLVCLFAFACLFVFVWLFVCLCVCLLVWKHAFYTLNIGKNKGKCRYFLEFCAFGPWLESERPKTTKTNKTNVSINCISITKLKLAFYSSKLWAKTTGNVCLFVFACLFVCVCLCVFVWKHAFCISKYMQKQGEMLVFFEILRFRRLTWIGETKNNKNKQNKCIYQLHVNYKIKSCVLHFKYYLKKTWKCLFVCLFVCVFACLFVCVFVCLFVCLTTCVLHFKYNQKQGEMHVFFGILRFGSLTWIGKTKNNKNEQNKHIYKLHFNYKIKTCVLHFKIIGKSNGKCLFVCLLACLFVFVCLFLCFFVCLFFFCLFILEF